MNTATMNNRQDIVDAPHMNGAFIKSALFHVVIVAVSILGLPHMAKDYPIPDNSIAVEIVEIDKITQTDRAPAPTAKPAEDTPKAQPRDVPPPSDKPKPPTVTTPEPPKPVAPEKPATPDDIAPPEEKVKPAPPKPAPPKPKTRPEPPKPKVEETAKESEQDFNALLRNLMVAEPQSTPTENEGQGQQKAPQATLGTRMTMSEMDAVRFQLGQCWKLLAGARYAEELVVEVRLTINPDRTVRDARIVDQLRYNTDSFFRAAADSAYRAVFASDCNPLKLPAEKYDQWKTMTVRFDPRDML